MEGKPALNTIQPATTISRPGALLPSFTLNYKLVAP
jgi:hypothetical protein